MLKTETYIINLDKLMNNKDELASFNNFYNSKKDKCNLQIIFISYKPAINCDEFEQWIFENTPCHVDSGEPDTLIFTDDLRHVENSLFWVRNKIGELT
jgi:hypothetical protein